MMNKKLPKSVRKHIRLEKARLRRQVLNKQKQQEMIEELYKKYSRVKKEKKSKK